MLVGMSKDILANIFVLGGEVDFFGSKIYVGVIKNLGIKKHASSLFC